jgi:hypothetical protein
MGRIRYFRSDTANMDADLITEPLLTRPYYVKSQAYSHENEVRFSMEISPYQCNSDELGGIMLNIDPKRLIKKVLISPSFIDAEAKSLRDLIKGVLTGIPVEVSEVKNVNPGQYSAFTAIQNHFSDPFAQLRHEIVNNSFQPLPDNLFTDV